MVRKKAIRWVVSILFAYILIGLVYFFSGFLYNIYIGKQNIFSPIIGIPLTISGLPWMLYADIINVDKLGLKFSVIITLSVLSVIIMIFIFAVVKQINNAKKINPDT